MPSPAAGVVGAEGYEGLPPLLAQPATLPLQSGWQRVHVPEHAEPLDALRLRVKSTGKDVKLRSLRFGLRLPPPSAAAPVESGAGCASGLLRSIVDACFGVLCALQGQPRAEEREEEALRHLQSELAFVELAAAGGGGGSALSAAVGGDGAVARARELLSRLGRGAPTPDGSAAAEAPTPVGRGDPWVALRGVALALGHPAIVSDQLACRELLGHMLLAVGTLPPASPLADAGAGRKPPRGQPAGKRHKAADGSSTMPGGSGALELEIRGFPPGQGLAMGRYVQVPGARTHGAPLFRHAVQHEHFIFRSGNTGMWLATNDEDNIAVNTGLMRFAASGPHGLPADPGERVAYWVAGRGTHSTESLRGYFDLSKCKGHTTFDFQKHVDWIPAGRASGIKDSPRPLPLPRSRHFSIPGRLPSLGAG